MPVRVTVAALALIVAASCVWAEPSSERVGPFSAVPGSSNEGSRTSLTSGLHPFTETVRFNQGDEGRSIDELEITCNGGLAEIEWYVGNIEPTVPDTGIHINLWMDDHLLSSGLRGSTRGIWNDVPITIRAVVECSPGKHTLEAKLTYVRGSWGIPYVVNPGNEPSTDLIVQRGFVVLEVWDPET